MKFIFLVLMVIFLIGCATIESEDNNILPDSATNIVNLGNGWTTFDLMFNGKIKTFMFYRSKSATGYRGYCAITEISK